MPALRLVDLKKSYGGVLAVGGVSESFEAGTIHAVIGENGAGKSTLLKMAAGVVEPDGGAVHIEGTRLVPHRAAQAIALGVGMVQQHFALVPVFSVLENLTLGAEPVTAGGRVDYRAAAAKARSVFDQLGVKLPLGELVEKLGIGDRQRLEIARVLYRDARVVILDEPTAVLTAGEAETLYGILRRLASGGRLIIVVTHKLDEVVRHADRITVIRRGAKVESRELPPVASRSGEAQRLAASIMGGAVPSGPTKAIASIGGPALVLKRVSLGRALRDVSLEVRSGEIVGIAGIEGNGQRELVEVVAGLARPESGTVWPSPEAHAAERPAAVVLEDRHKEGLVLTASLRDNLVLGELERFSTWGFVRTSRLEDAARVRCDRGGVQPHDLDLPAAALSGGNQQKILIARALARVERGASVLVLAHPTRGVDIGSSRAIHAQVLEAVSRRRCGAVVVSSDLEELRALSDRIVVMAHGRVVATLAPTASDVEIGAHMLAGREQEVAS